MPLFNREPVAAGAFYPLDSKKLIKVLKDLFPGKPFIRRSGYLHGLIAPHAGYVYSGRTAAKAYYELSQFKARTFVVLGPNHTGMGESLSVMYNANYQTPLGKVKTDVSLGRRVCKELGVNNDFLAHSKEHSIEIQLPFLQYVYDEFNILPIVIGDLSLARLKELGSLLAQEDVTIIASSDFTHHGSVYGYSPLHNVKVELREHDMKAIEEIQRLNVNEFFKVTEDSTICGRNPITVLLQAMKARGAKSRFIEYSTSADVTKDYDNVVSYASIIFK